jgi:site-specific recombinase XerD
MFDQLYTSPLALASHRSGPLLEERRALLTHLTSEGYCRMGLRRKASDLLRVARMLGLASRSRKALTLAEVKRKMANHRGLYPFAIRWLQFVGRLHQRPASLTPSAKKIKVFAAYMEHEQKLSPKTIHSRCWVVTRFLDQFHVKDGSLHKITPQRIDMAFQKMLGPGGCSRTSVQMFATTLRAFFRFAETRGWCRKGLVASIRAPRVFSQASVPLGPSWDDVRRLLAMTEGDERHNIRARPILMLLAVYGLRDGEVRRLRLDDFDWEHEVFRIASSKTKRSRTYPLTRSVGDAILRYLQEVRPQSSYREVFLSLHPPFRPMRTSLWKMVFNRLRALDVSLPHYGPHALRHACATRLLAAGLSLKHIGDQLGHTNPESTRIYAKVDLVGLRQVADFDLGGVL